MVGYSLEDKALTILLKNILSEKHSFAHCLWGWGFHVKSVFFFNIFSGDVQFDVLIKGLC